MDQVQCDHGVWVNLELRGVHVHSEESEASVTFDSTVNGEIADLDFRHSGRRIVGRDKDAEFVNSKNKIQFDSGTNIDMAIQPDFAEWRVDIDAQVNIRVQRLDDLHGKSISDE